jgi:DNA-binding transcriptional LysR family regulator
MVFFLNREYRWPKPVRAGYYGRGRDKQSFRTIVCTSGQAAMSKIQEMSSFAAVVEAGSFVAAADATGLSKAAVSRHVSNLEKRLGVRLLHRTTRRLSLTEEGQTFLTRVKDVLSAIDEAESELTARSVEASGVVRVNAPLTFGALHLAPLWSTFLEANPKVTLDITLGDRTVDLIEEGYDLAIRIATSPGLTVVSRRLATTRVVLCASRRYLKKHGTPRHPRDLATHAVISYSYWSQGDEWTFNGPDGPVSVMTTSRIHANNGDTCRSAALAHQGIILQPDFLVGADLRRGDLIELLPQFPSIDLGIFAVYPTRKHLPLKLRRLIDFLAEAFRSPPW